MIVDLFESRHETITLHLSKVLKGEIEGNIS